jgi:hypothetical protein
MSSRAAEFASAILIGVLVGVFAGAYLITMPYGEADDCLSEPKGDTPPGQHWFYRIDRGTKRHCWYLKGQGEKVARAATREPSDSVKSDSVKSDSAKTASRKTDTAAQHSVSDAHAELRSRARIEDNTSAARPTVGANPVDDNGANVMTRWPEPAGVSSSANAPQETPPVVVADNTQSDPAAAEPATPAPTTTTPTTTAPTTIAPMTNDATADTAAPVAATTPAEKYTGSLQELMVVALAALALAGLTGSAVYRLARLRFARRRYDASRRSADWQPSKKKSRKARAAANARPVAVRAEKVSPSSNHVLEPDFAPQPEYAPQPQYAAPQPQYAPRPEYAPQPQYASRPERAPRPEQAPRPNFDPQQNVAVLSEYAPKPRPAMRTTRELEDSFESIEELLMRLAK